MRRPRFNTLTAQLITVMLLALATSFGIAMVLSRNQTQRALQDIRREDTIGRTAAVASLLRNNNEASYPAILRSINAPFHQYWLTPGPPADPIAFQGAARPRLLAIRIGGSNGPSSLTASPSGGTGTQELFHEPDLPDVQTQWEDVTVSRDGTTFTGRYVALGPWNGVGVVFQVADGLYVNAVNAKPRSMEQGNTGLYASFALSAAAVSIGSVLIARRVGRPLKQLAEVAECLGRGEDVDALPQARTRDVRATVDALGRMQERVRRFVDDRTNMVAAMSHDLRTPITSLRLRAEFIKETEARDKIVATLDELQRMVDATLAFARGESVVEPTRLVELGSVVSSLCDDLAAIGWDVAYKDAPRTPVRCRPEALVRALRNVVENAVRYGARARVRLTQDADHHEIVVDDDGPGIPPHEAEHVFAPFVRLESSRNRDTGGVGLGLAVARTIAHQHGGDVLLANRPEGGLRVRVRLPRTA